MLVQSLLRHELGVHCHGCGQKQAEEREVERPREETVRGSNCYEHLVWCCSVCYTESCVGLKVGGGKIERRRRVR